MQRVSECRFLYACDGYLVQSNSTRQGEFVVFGQYITVGYMPFVKVV